MARHQRIEDRLWKEAVTAENIEDVRDKITPFDQKSAVEIGDIVSSIIFDYGSVGTLTIYHNRSEAAIDFGADSDWGDWDPGEGMLVTDDCAYRVAGPSIVEMERPEPCPVDRVCNGDGYTAGDSPCGGEHWIDGARFEDDIRTHLCEAGHYTPGAQCVESHDYCLQCWVDEHPELPALIDNGPHYPATTLDDGWVIRPSRIMERSDNDA